MVVRNKRDMRPLLLKLGAALALSFAGFLYTHLQIRKIRPARFPPSPPSSGHCNKVDSDGRAGIEDENSALITAQNCEEVSHQVIETDNCIARLSPSSKHSGVEEGFLLPEFNELVLKDFELFANSSPRKDVEIDTTFRKAADKEMEEEIINLRNMVKFLQDKERELQIQLLKYYGLKEQESVVSELQNRLKINNMEAKLFTLKMESLQADNRRLKAQVVDYSRVVAELEPARARIKLLKREIRSDVDQNQEQLSTLQQRIANLRDQEQRPTGNDEEVQKKLQTLKDLEDESAELRKANLKLQHENSELLRRVESTQILASSILEDPEAEALQEANHHLRQENKDLIMEIEQLQDDRCSDLEELVYLRWVNACLRYELRSYQPSPGKTVARDLSKTLSPKSEEKVKQLILEYASLDGVGDKDVSLMDFDSGYWSSSQASNLTDSGDFDDSSADISSATRNNCTTKTKFCSKLKRLVLGKESHNNNQVVSGDRTASCAASRSRLSVSASSFEELVGTSCSATLSSKHNSRISETPPAEIEARTEQMNKITLSHSLSRPPLNIQRLRHLSLEDFRGLERVRRNSDLGSSYAYERMFMGKDGAISLHEDNQLNRNPDALEKLELMKFAEALKGSHGTPNSERRSASYSSL